MHEHDDRNDDAVKCRKRLCENNLPIGRGDNYIGR